MKGIVGMMMVLAAMSGFGADLRIPRPAEQREVDAGEEPRAYVSPLTLANYSGLTGASNAPIIVNGGSGGGFLTITTNSIGGLTTYTFTLNWTPATNGAPAVLRDSVQIYPFQATNVWMDFGLTNSYGQKYTYQDLLATNDVRFFAVTNPYLDGLISISVTASGANRLVMFPTNLPHFRTNGLTLTGSLYAMTLTNGNEVVFTLRSNHYSLTTIWSPFGQ